LSPSFIFYFSILSLAFFSFLSRSALWISMGGE